jgi:2-polyprenyl-3-methyl-5-hydroxy-6-metoxy-1,4-benzoquinol methylase
MSTTSGPLTITQRLARRTVRYGAPGVDNFSHPDRVRWMRSHIPPSARVLEIGCGTGWHVTLPLLQSGLDVTGADLDEESIAYGRAAFRRQGADENALQARDARDLAGSFDVIIASELLEHLDDTGLREMLAVITSKLTEGGRLLVTVPSGYGWFELDSFLWNRTPLGRVFTRTRLSAVIRRLKTLIVSGATRNREPNTLSACPHAQRFTLRDLIRRLGEAGFVVEDARGSVMFCGPLTNLMFAGSRTLQRVNVRLALRFPAISSGFYVAARATEAAEPG